MRISVINVILKIIVTPILLVRYEVGVSVEMPGKEGKNDDLQRPYITGAKQFMQALSREF